MTTTLIRTSLATPVGRFSALADGTTIVAAGFTDDERELRRLLPPALKDATVGRTDSPLTDVLARYFEGDVRAIDDLQVSQPGGAFTRRAHEALRAIPAGSTLGYAALAVEAGSPAAARAAGRACATNRVSLVVPCHRVVPAAGGVGSYLWGSPVKEWLLAHEGATI